MEMEPLVYEYIASEVTYPDKTVIIDEGSRGKWVYVVLDGRVKVKKKTPGGMVTINTLTEGEIFGEMVLLEGVGGTRGASAVAEGEARLGVLDTDRLIKDYQAMSPRLRDLFRSLIEKLRDITARVCNVLAGST